MLILRALAIFLAVCATTFFGVFWLGYSSCKEPPKQNNEAAEAINPHQDNCSATYGTLKVGVSQIGDFFHEYHEETIAIATILLTFVTAGLVWVGYVQIRTTRAQLRAYVFSDYVVLKKLNVGDIQEYLVLIKNTGQTPAYHVVHITGFAFMKFPLKEPLSAVAEKFSRSPLGPGQNFENSGAAPKPFTAEVIEALKDGKGALYVYGRIDFVDAFKKPRWVKYRYMTGGNIGFHTDGKLTICEEGNETSED